MDKYINMLFLKISQNYKISIITIMVYNDKYKKINKSYKLTIDKKKLKKPDYKFSMEFRSKQYMIQEMIKWI